MLPFYVMELVDLQGRTIELIDDLISVEAARAFNVDGSATIILPEHWKRSLFRMHTRARLWRYDYYGRSVNFGDTLWFLKKTDHAISDHTYTLTLVDAFAMLNARIVAYTAQTPFADKTLEEFALITFDDSLRIDTMMVEYMKENWGEEVLDNDRLNTFVTIEESKNQGPYGEKQAAWSEMGAVLSDLAKQASANGLNLFYDLIPQENGTFNFRVWSKVRGKDRSSTSRSNLVLSDTDGMLSDIHEIEDFTEVATVCYALGYDSGPSQVVEVVTSPFYVRNDPFGRIEMTVNASDSDVSSVLQAQAQAALNGRRPRHRVTAKVVENSSLVYGDKLSYGDLLSIQVAGRQYDVAIDAVSVRWDAEGEQLDIRLNGEEAVPVVTDPFTPTPGIPVGEVNTPPVVDAGDNQEIDFGETADLVGSAVDDGLPDPPAALTYEWSKVSGPGDVTFGDDTDPTTTADFSEGGTYVLRLAASDGALSGTDDVTISVDVAPPDFGLLEGTGDVAVIALDGNLYRTTDFQTVSGSGGPTWSSHDLGITETIFTWVVDPFSPGYLNGDGTGTINGWIVTEDAIYRLTDMFGTVATSAVHTFAEAVDATLYHWRTIQASFGAFFSIESGDNPWLLCISYYGDTSGHEGTWATFSIDGGTTWSTEVQLADGFSDSDETSTPIGVYTSPKTPGYALTVARSDDDVTGLPHFVYFNTSGVMSDLGAMSTYDLVITRLDTTSGGGGDSGLEHLMIAPPDGASKVIFTVNWTVTKQTNGSGSVSSVVTVQSSPATVDIIDDNDYDDGSDTADETLQGSFGVEATLDSPFASNTWPGTISQIGTAAADATTEFGVGLQCNFAATAIGGTPPLASIQATLTIFINQVELEDGTIYTFGPEPSVAQESDDWGETWATSALFTPGAAMAGTIHLPWLNNDDEDVIYHGRLDASNGLREFKLIRMDGGVETDISPSDGSINYGVNRGHFAARTFDSNPQYVLASVVGNDTTNDPADDMHAVYISDDSGATWTEVVAPVDNTNAPTGRPAFEAAFAGDTEQVIYIWGAKGYISYSDDFGATVDDRSGNLPADVEIVGIAGGPTGP